MPVIANPDTSQERKKAQVVNLLRKLIEQVESDNAYGEFGITFMAQNGLIGHIVEKREQTYK